MKSVRDVLTPFGRAISMPVMTIAPKHDTDDEKDPDEDQEILF